MKFVKKHYVHGLICVWAAMIVCVPLLFALSTPEKSQHISRELAFRLGIIVSALSVGLQAFISLREKWVK